MKYSSLLFVVVLTSLSLVACDTRNNKATADPIQILQSPDGTLVLRAENKEGRLRYSLARNGVTLLEPSLLGLEAKRFDASRNLRLITASRKTHKKSWRTVWGASDSILDHHHELKLELNAEPLTADHRAISIIVLFRLFNDGLAFRYQIPKKNNLNYIAINNEVTEFRFSEDSESWWIPAYSYRRYEFLYAHSKISEISRDFYSKNTEDLSNKAQLGPDAVNTPFTTQRMDGIVLSIHEAALTNYPAMTLAVSGTKSMTADLVPWSDGVKVKASKVLKSPWRTINVAENAASLQASNMVLNLNEPNRIKDTSWIQPGKYMGIWWEMIGTNQSTWGSGLHHAANTKKVKEYIDFASSHNFDGLLVEGWNIGWDDNWCCSGDGGPFSYTQPYEDFHAAEIADYAQSKNIALVGHHETGSQIQNYESQLEDAMQFAADHDIAVIKTGYVNDQSRRIKRYDKGGNLRLEWHHGQYMVRHFRRVIETAAKYHISLVAHEPIKDTGIRRTYPNMLSREGARGQEFNGFMAKDSHNGAQHTTILPFTRLLGAAPMDYTPGIFNLHQYRYKTPEKKVIDPNFHIPSTVSKELALYIVIYAPMQMAADLPENYQGHPAFDFILDVPTDWKRSEYIDAEIGKYSVVARLDRHSDDWYLGAITNHQARTINVPLSFLSKNKSYRAKIYADPKDGGWQAKPEAYTIHQHIVNSDDSFPLHLVAGGGVAIAFTPVQKQ